VALLPTLALGLLLRLWAIHAPVSAVNSDEALTGLQAYDVLDGQVAVMVAGNEYGGAVESFLLAPLLLVSSGVLPLKAVPIALTLVAAGALAWTARPLLSPGAALMVGATAWVSSAVAISISSLNYMGYASGQLAMILAMGCSVRVLARHERRLWPAFLAGLATGVAMWCHPMFGVVSVLAVLPVVAACRRSARTVAVLLSGGVLGVLPWLVYLVPIGLPTVNPGPIESTYPGRIGLFVTELVPSGFGLRAGEEWVQPSWLAQGMAALVLAAALLGLVLLRRRAGERAWPVVLAGWGAFPALAVFQALAYTGDGRYSTAFIPPLLLGVFSWTLLLPQRLVDRPVTVLTVPLLWGLLACVPALSQRIGWTWQDVNRPVERLASTIEQRGMTALRGNYWGVYLIDYFAEGRLDALPDSDLPVRLLRDAERAKATDVSRVAFAYGPGKVQAGAVSLPAPIDQYDSMTGGAWEVWIPRELDR
jgi:hypothetical protein